MEVMMIKVKLLSGTFILLTLFGCVNIQGITGDSNEGNEISISILQESKDNKNPQDRVTTTIPISELDPKFKLLNDLLKNKEWKQADRETWSLILEIANRTEQRFLQVSDIISIF